MIHHVFSPTLAHYPVLNLLRRPIVFSVAANVGSNRPADFSKMKRWKRIIVSNSRDFDRLNSWGFNNSEVVLPGIDLSGFSRLPPPPGKFTLLMASAPWEKKQFETKGINLLLEAVKAMPEIKLILLWRGLYINDLRQKVAGLNLASQVEIIDRKVNVSAIMERTHVTVLLAKEAGLVKAFPHSLIESLASGRPVMLNDLIPMADYVKRNKCGTVLAECKAPNLIDAISTMRIQYGNLFANIPDSIANEFSMASMIKRLKVIYGKIK
jgi:glycosyltransferase involved in cell wall biosynthesis